MTRAFNYSEEDHLKLEINIMEIIEQIRDVARAVQDAQDERTKNEASTYVPDCYPGCYEDGVKCEKCCTELPSLFYNGGLAKFITYFKNFSKLLEKTDE